MSTGTTGDDDPTAQRRALDALLRWMERSGGEVFTEEEREKMRRVRERLPLGEAFTEGQVRALRFARWLVERGLMTDG